MVKLNYVLIGKRIKDRRKELDMTQKQLGKLVKLTEGSVSKYESGQVESAPTSKFNEFADALKVDISWLLGTTKKSMPGRLPLIGCIRAGLPILAEENWEAEIEVPSTIKADFALRIEGDSMIYAGILPGDIVLLKQSSEANSGDIVAAGVEDSSWSANLKYFVKSKGNYCLRSANPYYSDIEYTENHRIIGVMEGLIRETSPSVSEYRTILNLNDEFKKDWMNVIIEAEAIGLNAEKVRNLIEIQKSMLDQLSKK